MGPGRESVQLFMQPSGTHCFPALELCGKQGLWSRAGHQLCARAGIAERVGEALQELSASQEEAKVGSSQGPWQYDAVYAETGFHKQAHNHIQAALHAANIEIQVRWFWLYSFADAPAPCAEPPEPVCLQS